MVGVPQQLFLCSRAEAHPSLAPVGRFWTPQLVHTLHNTMNLFGKKKKAAPKLSDSIHQLRDALNVLDKREKYLEKQMNTCVADAKRKMKAKDKRGSLVVNYLTRLFCIDSVSSLRVNRTATDCRGRCPIPTQAKEDVREAVGPDLWQEEQHRHADTGTRGGSKQQRAYLCHGHRPHCLAKCSPRNVRARSCLFHSPLLS